MHLECDCANCIPSVYMYLVYAIIHTDQQTLYQPTFYSQTAPSTYVFSVCHHM